MLLFLMPQTSNAQMINEGTIDQGFILSGIFVVITLILLLRSRRKYKMAVEDQKKLVQKIDLLEQELETAKQVKVKVPELISSKIEQANVVALKKDKIEKAINSKLGESSWMILNLLFKNPSISNKEIAKQMNLSVEGVSSSLRRMYNTFNIVATSNKKLNLIMTATRISEEK